MRTEITIEVEEVIQASGHGKRLAEGWCAACGAGMTMVSPQQAAVMARVTVREINRWVESELIHFMETGDGLLLICVNSLRESVKSQTAKGE
jgi:hypothetical protein